MVVGESVTSTLERCALGSVLAGVIIVAGALAPPATAQDGGKEGVPETGPPALSIDLNGEANRLAAGEEIEYTLSLANDGDHAVRGATLSQSLPEQLEVVSAGDAAEQSDGFVGWEVNLAPGEAVQRELRVRVGEDAGDEWRLATTACAQITAQSPPVVCATDASLLDARSPTESKPAPVAQESRLSPAKIAGVAVVLGVVIASIVAALVAQWRYRPAGRH
ncbi:putative repeat protein (TIGR01451 family) [Lipingzhangella halophila]|uniref:Putative repeat protein (TIGR01451 family) n=1 Tax=Lipingzhangella halophila TaxID=1783352 RepID=A0A7W7RFA8_9ACTN|nr:DUF11 domain-containing protein [Lipingzhangella halophila]MBB4930785.1 putative repeat protein (TIGR01451 family) [Lipingzhangella halophila]